MSDRKWDERAVIALQLADGYLGLALHRGACEESWWRDEADDLITTIREVIADHGA